MFFEEHLETLFDEEYEKVYYSTKQKLENDPKYTFKHLKVFLESLYNNEGNDWYGRGELFQVKINAQIAATECLRDEFSHMESSTK